MQQEFVSQQAVDARDRDRRGGRVRGRSRSRGQVLVIFAMSIFVFVGLCAVVIDVAWYWASSLRVQRAADAAALAGAVLLPDDVANAQRLAREEATKNGYTAGGGVTVTPCSDANKPAGCTGGGGNPNQMNVTISAPVPTFFMRVFGMTSITATRSAKAEYVLPVPMGSPQNYYGVGLLSIPTPQDGNTGFQDGSPTGSSGWTGTTNADATQNTRYAVSPTANASLSQRQQQWTSFFPSSGTGVGSIPNPVAGGSITIDSISVRTRVFISAGTGSSTTCQLQAELYRSGTWSDPVILPTPLPTSRPTDYTYLTFAPTTPPTATWGETWTRSQLTTTNFRVRLTIVRGTTAGCNTNRQLSVDTLEVRVDYTLVGAPAPVDVHAPDGTLLTPQKFWGGMQSQGAPSVQGDAYMTGYATRKSPVNGAYDPQKYYNYGIDIKGSGGQVWIFDPGFCDTTPFNTLGDPGGHPEANINQGTGESWTPSSNGSNTGSNGALPVRPVSAQYNLYDTHDTPYTTDDDTLVATSGSTFRQSNLTDLSLDGDTGADYSNPTDCSGLAWHNNWWALPGAQNLSPGTYRLQTTSRIYNAAIGSHPQDAVLDATDNQTDATGLNAFAIWTTSTGTVAPRVHGLGAMEHISRSLATRRRRSTWPRSTPTTRASGWTSTSGIREIRAPCRPCSGSSRQMELVGR